MSFFYAVKMLTADADEATTRVIMTGVFPFSWRPLG